MIRRRTITSYVWNSVSGNKRVILSNCIRNFFRKFELIGNSVQGENPAPDNPQEIKSAGKWNEEKQKYEIDVKVTGKNLFDSRYASNPFNWVDSGDGFKTLNKPLITNGEEYTISSIKLLPKGLGFNFLISESFERLSVKHYYFYHNGNSPAIKDRVTVRGSDNLYLKMTGDFDSFASNLLNILQFEKGGNKTPYEPYTEQSMQIVLNEPLRGIGEYKDVLTKDGVVRKIYPPYEINLNDLRDGGYSRTNTVMFSVKVQNKTVGYASLKPSILCNILPDCGLQTGNIYNDDKECIAVGGGIVLFRVNKSRLKDISSFEAIKQSFIELIEGKKMLVEYALETSVTEPLPESVQAQLSSLHSENGTTHVFVDSGEVETGINIEYKYKS